jgi:hypothetical protein
MLNEQLTWLNLSCNISFNHSHGDAMRHIFVVNNGLLLEEGIVKLLASRDGLNVLSIDFVNEEALVREIEALCPNAVIINREGSIDLARFFNILAGLPDFNRLQILIVSANSNMIDVYENQQVYELHSQDFFDFVKGIPIK